MRFLHRLITTTIAAAAVTLSVPAGAQERKPQEWFKVCNEVAGSEICVVQFNIVTPTNQLVTGVNLLTSKGKTNRKIYQVAVPTGRFIPAGVKMKIDNGKENKLPYSLCLPDRCVAEVPLNDSLINALKAGGEITLTSTNFRAQANPVKVSLKGFTKAFDGPPLKQDQVEARNKQIADELKKKADAARKKLQEAQEKAKSGG